MARYSLFVLKVSLNQPTNQAASSCGKTGMFRMEIPTH